MSKKDDLLAGAEKLEDTALLADFFAGLAERDGELEKADAIHKQATDLRDWANIYRLAAETSSDE